MTAIPAFVVPSQPFARPTWPTSPPAKRTGQDEIDEAIDILRCFVPRAAPSLDAAEAAALSVLYRNYSAMVIGVCRRILASEHDAEDVLHDIFLKLPRTIAQYRDGGFGGWLRQVATRTSLMRLRRPSAASVDLELIEAGDDVVADRHLAELERQTVVRAAIDTLAAPLRDVIVQRMFHDLSHQEIAANLGITKGASEVRLCRAIKQLRVHLRSYH